MWRGRGIITSVQVEERKKIIKNGDRSNWLRWAYFCFWENDVARDEANSWTIHESDKLMRSDQNCNHHHEQSDRGDHGAAPQFWISQPRPDVVSEWPWDRSKLDGRLGIIPDSTSEETKGNLDCIKIEFCSTKRVGRNVKQTNKTDERNRWKIKKREAEDTNCEMK